MTGLYHISLVFYLELSIFNRFFWEIIYIFVDEHRDMECSRSNRMNIVKSIVETTDEIGYQVYRGRRMRINTRSMHLIQCNRIREKKHIICAIFVKIFGLNHLPAQSVHVVVSIESIAYEK